MSNKIYIKNMKICMFYKYKMVTKLTLLNILGVTFILHIKNISNIFRSILKKRNKLSMKKKSQIILLID